MTDRDTIAIVGLAGRFPGAPDVAGLWERLCAGDVLLSHFGPEEADPATPAAVSHPDFVGAEGVLDDAEAFDAELFGLTVREASLTDPQHRLLLECSWLALEQAGVRARSGPTHAGVFLASGSTSYLVRNLLPNRELVELFGGFHLLVHNDKDFASSLVSYRLDLTGPSVSVASACSSSLVAVHLACQSLLGHECDVALAGGASVQVPQRQGYVHHAEGIYSPDGWCRPFDARAAGTVGGSGAGVVVLKRLEDAVTDGDHVWAVVLGSAINNDGGARLGFTAPSARSQAAVVAEALAVAGVEPASIGYVEAHGSGTPLGDQVELAALAEAFEGVPAGSCALGAVKANVGHLDAAAGVTGLIKAALAVHHGVIPPHPTFELPHPALDRTPFYIPSRMAPWPGGERPRRAGVSAFGAGGTNAHVVIESPPVLPPRTTSERAPHLLLVSARTESVLDSHCADVADQLERCPSAAGDLALSLGGRRPSPVRRAFVGPADRLASAVATGAAVAGGRHEGDPPGVVLALPDGATASAGMAADLAAHLPAFRRWIDRGIEVAGALGCPELGPALLDPGAGELLATTAVAGPALFAHRWALARTLIELGVEPEAVVGWGSGQLIAAALTGAHTFEAGLTLAVEHGEPAAGPAEALGLAPDDRRIVVVVGPGTSLAGIEDDDRIVVDGLEGANDVLAALGRLWVAGVAVDVTALERGRGARRAVAPVPPFQRRRCWIDPPAPPEAEGLPRERQAPDRWLYVPTWHRAAPCRPSPVAGPGTTVVLTAGPVGESLADALEARGRTVIRVPAAAGVDVGATVAAVEPGAGELTIVHAWLLETEPTSTAEATELGLHTLLGIVRVLGSARRSARLVVLTSGVQDVLGGDVTRPERATVLAAAKVVPLELRGVVAKAVDIDLGVGCDLRWLVDRLADEVDAEDGEVLVALRGRARFLPSVTAAPAPGPVPLHRGGVYLVTGGTGGIGSAVAAHLGSLPATVVVTSRSGFPPRSSWEARRSDDDAVGQAISRFLDVEAGGGRVVVAGIDVTDLEGMRALVRSVEDRHGPISGVVHASGMRDRGGVVARRTRASVDEVLAAKVDGPMVLDEVFRGRRLDFFLLCSSLGSLLYKLKFGEIAYVAANDALAAFAAHRHAREGDTVTVAWTDWLTSGMGARARAELVARHGGTVAGIGPDFLQGLTDEEGIDVFRRALGCGAPNLLACTLDLPRLLRHHDALSAEEHRALIEGAAPAEPGGARSADQLVAVHWAALLGVDAVAPDDNFFALGGDSLLALRFLARVRDELGVDYPMERFYEVPDAAALARELDAFASPLGGDLVEVLL